MPAKTKMPYDEYKRRRDAPKERLNGSLVGAHELTDICLDALLGLYLDVAESCGRLSEVPQVLNLNANAIQSYLANKSPAKPH